MKYIQIFEGFKTKETEPNSVDTYINFLKDIFVELEDVSGINRIDFKITEDNEIDVDISSSLKPKEFELVFNKFEKRLSSLGFYQWINYRKRCLGSQLYFSIDGIKKIMKMVNESKNDSDKFIDKKIVEILSDLSINLSDIGMFTEIKIRPVGWDKVCPINFHIEPKFDAVEVRLFIEDKFNIFRYRNEMDWLIDRPIIRESINRLKGLGYTRDVDYKIYGGRKIAQIVFGEFSY